MMIAMRWKFYYIRKTCTEGEKSRKNDFSDLYIYGSSSRARRELFPSITAQTARSNPSNRSVNELCCSQRAKITARWYFYLHTQRNTNEHVAELFDFIFLLFFSFYHEQENLSWLAKNNKRQKKAKSVSRRCWQFWFRMATKRLRSDRIKFY